MLLTQLLIYPIVDNIRNDAVVDTFLNSHIEEEVLNEFKLYQEELRLQQLIVQAPSLSSVRNTAKAETKSNRNSRKISSPKQQRDR